jgi:TetR/AcrR family transcriptional regulator, fatty acid metabolism regulator protein
MILILQVFRAISYALQIAYIILCTLIDNGNDFFLSNERSLLKGLKTLIIRAIDQNKIRSDVSEELLEEELLIISRGIIYHWCVSNGNVDILDNTRKIVSNYIKAYQIKKDGN